MKPYRSPTDVVVFHAGTSTSNNKTVTSGGRVLAVTAYAPTLQAALDAAYAGVDKIDFDGKTYRRDIAHRSVISLMYRLFPSKRPQSDQLAE